MTGELPKPRLEPTINYGHIISALTFLFTVGGFLWWQSSFQTEMKLEQDRDRELRTIYIPIINSISEANKVQDARIAGMTDSLIAIQKSLEKLSEQLTATRLELVEIKSKLNDRRASRYAP